MVAPAVVYNTWNTSASWPSQYVMVAKPNGSGNKLGLHSRNQRAVDLAIGLL